MSELTRLMRETDEALIRCGATVECGARLVRERAEWLRVEKSLRAQLAAQHDETQKARAEVERLREQVRRLADHAEAFAETVEHAERCRDARGQGGQQVPYHGDFASVTPSVAGRLAWWARQARAVLATLPREEGT